MSSKNSKKITTTAPNSSQPIVTRTKSSQQRRQPRNKFTKTQKPETTKPEIKSSKLEKCVIPSKDTLVKNRVKRSSEVFEQVEYYPNKLKRNLSTKKIMLKPKHNFKVIASTNKRKLATPKKGIKSPLPSKKQKSARTISNSPKQSENAARPSVSPELSVQDLVRAMEENKSLSDEDFMEILTCPSPVWWEDPPDGRYIEDSIYTMSPEPPSKKTNKKENKEQIRKKTTRNIEQLNISVKNDDRFRKKQLKLENILGSIKNKSIKQPVDSKDDVKDDEILRNRKISESTEGDFSDMSFNEEEILKNLENMDIPIQQTKNEQNEDVLNIKKETEEIICKNESTEIEILPQLKIKQEIKEEMSIKDPLSDIGDGAFEETSSNMDKKLVEVATVNNCKNSNSNNPLLEGDCSLNMENVNKTSVETNISDAGNKNNCIPNKKVINDLSEYITVYKIIPEKNKSENNLEINVKQTENTATNKLDNVRGKLNNFFKQCKSNKRLKKSGSPVPMTDVKETTDNARENCATTTDLKDENRLKPCEVCIEKIENGITDFACDQCEMAPIRACYSCNFLADTKEVYRKHISSCKNVARISWSHNLVLNRT